MKKNIYVLFVVLIFSCSESEIDYGFKNQSEIAKYITENNLKTTETSSGLHYVVTKDVKGDSIPNNTSNVTVCYKGYFTNKTVFDKSPTEGIELNVNQLISGFSEGIRLLSVGDEATLIIPSKLGYKNKTVGKIPAGSVLIFNVKLISINNKKP